MARTLKISPIAMGIAGTAILVIVALSAWWLRSSSSAALSDQKTESVDSADLASKKTLASLDKSVKDADANNSATRPLGAGSDEKPTSTPDSRTSTAKDDPQSSEAKLRIEVFPKTAEIRLDGKPLGKGSQDISVPRGDEDVRVEVSAPGFTAQTILWKPQRDEERSVRLARIGGGKKPQRQPGGQSSVSSGGGGKNPEDLRSNPYD